MFTKTFCVSTLLTALAAAAPAPQVAGYPDADASFPATQPVGPAPTSFGPDSQIPAIHTVAPPAPPRVSSDVTGATSHGPFSGSPTTTGAEKASTTLAQMIPPLPPNPTHTYYNQNGKPQQPAPIPYTPFGGLGTNGTEPRYMVNSDFDYESLALGLYQEWIELDLFNNGLAVFSEEDFLEAGLTAEDRAYIAYMAIQETGHATLLTNMLGHTAPVQCTYNYPFRTVREFIDFNQKLTRWGESGVWGFLNHLDSREAAQMLSQSIATEARQQISFRQMLGVPAMPEWFETGIPQSWAWTYLAPYISECPANQTRLIWQNFPALLIENQPNPNRVSPNDTKPWETVGRRVADPSNSTIPPEESCVNVNATGYSCGPAISRNRSEPLSFPGRQVDLYWELPGQAVGPNNSYVTSTSAGAPKFVAWVSQLNLTYTPLTVTGEHTGFTYQPAGEVYEGDPAVNNTMFVALTDSDVFLTPFNLSMINPHVVALGLYQAG
ncbi:ferritin-like domain-containing protein [Massariosphaeria phaeospora]|uniref:Ferritin-like domain-containing protein n=1 Tax=Massariosphaeria phaeospora TaxID=100035 RepID=A0A7C8M948_9PLEO|nr:ferritin-like domain-containing protein [Massariosphaeria phaeospora]